MYKFVLYNVICRLAKDRDIEYVYKCLYLRQPHIKTRIDGILGNNQNKKRKAKRTQKRRRERACARALERERVRERGYAVTRSAANPVWRRPAAD